MLRVCVIGMGPIGNRHARIYKVDPLAELVGVCDRDVTRMNAAMKTHGVQGFADAAKMLDALEPDVVSVATGGGEGGGGHYKPTLQGGGGGRPVLRREARSQANEKGGKKGG